MSSSKKRKTIEETPVVGQPKPASSSKPNVSSSTNHIPKYVYIAQELRGSPDTDDEHEILGVYAKCEAANSATHDYYNVNGLYGEWTIRKPIEPEHEQFRNGKEHSYLPDDESEESRWSAWMCRKTT